MTHVLSNDKVCYISMLDALTVNLLYMNWKGEGQTHLTALGFYVFDELPFVEDKDVFIAESLKLFINLLRNSTACAVIFVK